MSRSSSGMDQVCLRDMRFHRLNRLFALRLFDRFCTSDRLSAYRCLKVIFLIHSAAQHTLAGAVISSCLVASAPTPVSPLGSLPRFELFLLRPALATSVPPFWDVRFPFVGVAIEGNGSTPFFPAAMAGIWWMCVWCMLLEGQWRGVGVFEELCQLVDRRVAIP